MNEGLIPAICPYCGAGCALTVVVEEGRAVDLEYPCLLYTSDAADDN